jgi:hypothetical protein
LIVFSPHAIFPGQIARPTGKGEGFLGGASEEMRHPLLLGDRKVGVRQSFSCPAGTTILSRCSRMTRIAACEMVVDPDDLETKLVRKLENN